MPTKPDAAEPVARPPAAPIRLHVEAPLTGPASDIPLAAGQAHYLASVMRQALGSSVRLFNGRDGEWLANLVALDRKTARVRLAAQLRPQAAEPGPALLFALLKRDRLDLVVEKATELGCALLAPVLTRRTVTQPPNPARLAAIARQAAEQSGRLTLPVIETPRPLMARMRDWPAGRSLLVCDTGAGARPIAAVLAARGSEAGPAAILIGPEGGFAPSELDEVRALPFVVPVSLGPLVLRAETAAIAALACCRMQAATEKEG
jgi:16S rRNA (uracil1498-N3)-methyltransferase